MIEYTAYQIYHSKEHHGLFPTTEAGDEVDGKVSLYLQEDFSFIEIRAAGETILSSNLSAMYHEEDRRFTLVPQSLFCTHSLVREEVMGMWLETNPISGNLEFVAINATGQPVFEMFLAPQEGKLNLEMPEEDTVIH